MTTTSTREAVGSRQGRRRLRVLGTVVAWGLVALLAYLVWPTSLGGGTTAIVVNGHSMESTYHTGDIVVARTGEPQVGDIVIYSTPELGDGKIIHRIIGGDGETGWEIQGDNNDFVDPFRPTNEDILGIARLHLPAIGTWATVLQNPFVWGSFLLIAFALMMWPAKPCPEPDCPDDDDSASARDNTAATSTP